LNLKCDILISKFAFKCNLCRYITGDEGERKKRATLQSRWGAPVQAA
jgi:hypothetical protein